MMFFIYLWKSFSYTFGLYVIYKIYLYLRYIVYKLVLPFVSKPIDYKDYGKWAVVTGCTDGIGKAFTHELASMGLDMILISRSQEKLDNLAADLRTKYKIETKVIVADFRDTNEVVPVIRKELADEDIGILINNVGTALSLGSFLKNNKVRVNNLIEVNMKSMMSMCSIVLESMVKNRKGLIINVASLLSSVPSPTIATVYGASKAFMVKFSEDLHEEYKRQGIIVHCLKTGPVVTKLFNIKITNYITPTPERYVKSALRTIGLEKVTTGYSSHEIIMQSLLVLYAIAPEFYIWLVHKIETKLEQLALEYHKQHKKQF